MARSLLLAADSNFNTMGQNLLLFSVLSIEIISINRKGADVYTQAECIVSRNKHQCVGNLAEAPLLILGVGDWQGSSEPLNKTVVLMFKSSVWNHKQDDTALASSSCTICLYTSQDQQFLEWIYKMMKQFDIKILYNIQQLHVEIILKVKKI